MKTTIQTRCACGAVFPQLPAGGGASGYAVLPSGERICYPCADKRQIEELKDRSKPFFAYVGEGSITTWTGGVLMRITESRSCRLTASPLPMIGSVLCPSTPWTFMVATGLGVAPKAWPLNFVR